jgi:hypothetical protein
MTEPPLTHCQHVLYKDAARLIAKNITDSLTYTRFAQVCRSSRDVCKELLEETKHGYPFIKYLPGDQSKKHGYFEIRTYYQDLKSGYYKDNYYHGTIKSYDNGNLVDTSMYSNGLLHGTQYKYSQTETLVYKCEYKNGKKHGREWKKGKGTFGQTWTINNNGQLVYRLQHNKNGGVLDEYPKHIGLLDTFGMFKKPEYKELLAFASI